MKDAHERLKTLYAISKQLATFASVEESFAKILSLAAESFPLLSAVLIEHWEYEPRTTVWSAADYSRESLDLATLNAKNAYTFMSGASATQARKILEDISPITDLARRDQPRNAEKNTLNNYIVLPMMIDDLPPLGVLQLEGSAPLNEQDLEFVSALTDLISVALDRFHKTKEERRLSREERTQDLQDISTSKDKVESLEEERVLRESFVSLLSHDLRTPLSAAIMAAQLIQRRPEDTDGNMSLSNRIIDNIKRADHMIHNLLDANRIRSGEKLPLKLKNFELRSLVIETLEDLSTIHGDRLKLLDSKIVEVHWDKEAIRRILDNLCSNAIKYGAHRGIVTVTLKTLEREVEISVHNSGNVISPEDQKSLFKQFYRTGSAVSSNKAGWGIGLTLVRGAAEAHCGNVFVQSTEESGTTFLVTLPIDAS